MEELCSQWSLECLGDAYDEVCTTAGDGNFVKKESIHEGDGSIRGPKGGSHGGDGSSRREADGSRSTSRRKSLRTHLSALYPALDEPSCPKRRRTICGEFAFSPKDAFHTTTGTTALPSEDFQRKVSDSADFETETADVLQSCSLADLSAFDLHAASNSFCRLVEEIENIWASCIKQREVRVSLWRAFFERLEAAMGARPSQGALNPLVFDAWHAVGWTLIKDLACCNATTILPGSQIAVPRILQRIVEYNPLAAVFLLPRPPKSALTQFDHGSGNPEEGPLHWWIFTTFQCGTCVLPPADGACILCEDPRNFGVSSPCKQRDAEPQGSAEMETRKKARRERHVMPEDQIEESSVPSKEETDLVSEACVIETASLFQEMLTHLSRLEAEGFHWRRLEERFKPKGLQVAGVKPDFVLSKSVGWVSVLHLATASIEEPVFAFIRCLLVPLLFSAPCVERLEEWPGSRGTRALMSLLLVAVECVVSSVREERVRNGMVSSLPRLLKLKLNSWKIDITSPTPSHCCYRFDAWIQSFDLEKATILFLDYTLFIVHTFLAHFQEEYVFKKLSILSDLLTDFETAVAIIWRFGDLAETANYLIQPWWNFCKHQMPCCHTLPLCVPHDFILHLFAHSGKILPQFGIYDTTVKSQPLIKLWLDAHHVLGCALRRASEVSDPAIRCHLMKILETQRTTFISSVCFTWIEGPHMRIMREMNAYSETPSPPDPEFQKAGPLEKSLMLELSRFLGTLYTFRLH